MEEKKPIKVFPRRLARKMAKSYLDRQGVTGYNKPTAVMGRGMVGPSKSSVLWRHFAVEAGSQTGKKGRK